MPIIGYRLITEIGESEQPLEGIRVLKEVYRFKNHGDCDPMRDYYSLGDPQWYADKNRGDNPDFYMAVTGLSWNFMIELSNYLSWDDRAKGGDFEPDPSRLDHRIIAHFLKASGTPRFSDRANEDIVGEKFARLLACAPQDLK